MKAAILIEDQPHYRRAAFVEGLRACGYDIGYPDQPTKDDVLVMWNRKPRREGDCLRFEGAGARVVVCENGYIGKDSQGRQLYAIALHGHNGSGLINITDEDRWTPLGIPLEPYRERRGHFLVCGQRGIGSKTMASPHDWHGRRAGELRAKGYDVRIREHPGNQPAKVPLDADLVDTKACVIWSSASGVRAMTLGIPVIFDAPHWVCEAGAQSFSAFMERGTLVADETSRMVALQYMAHAQWRVDEIASGEPFRRLLQTPYVLPSFA